MNLVKWMNKTTTRAAHGSAWLLLLAFGWSTVQAGDAPPPVVVFAERQAPSAVTAAAQELLALTTIGEWDQREFRRPGRWDQLKAVRAQMDAGEWPAELA